MLRRLAGRVRTFVENEKAYPAIAGLAAGLYPLLYNYNSNYTLINSWEQFIIFLLSFIVAPIVIIVTAYRVSKNLNWFSNFQKYVVPVLNFSIFTGLMILSIHGPKKKLLLLFTFLAACLGLFLYRRYKEVIVIQFLMVITVLVTFVPYMISELNYSHAWTLLPDDIENAEFTKHPNVYIIQPDGYANFSELKGGYYDYDNSAFENYLSSNGFAFYDNFRSNYSNTVTSNSSMFAMMHHHYFNPRKDDKTPNRSRRVIAGDNPVVSIFRKNGYTTSLFLDKSYVLINRPKLLYDYCNIDKSDIPFFSRGLDTPANIIDSLTNRMDQQGETPGFYFIEKIKPGHIPVRRSQSEGWEAERDIYFDELEIANNWLKQLIDLITEKDKNSLIVIVSDHGGYVGWNYTAERRRKKTDRDKLHSVFTSILAVKWPDDQAPGFDKELRSNVNLFRILISYLSENTRYLKALQDNGSFLIINEGAPFGVYKVIDDLGNVVFDNQL